MIYLAVSFAFGVLQFSSARLTVILWPTYIHLLVLGWLTQLIFGVALWMFPRRSRQTQRAESVFGWACYWLLNTGLLLRAVAEPAWAIGYRFDSVLAAAALFQLMAGWIFVFLIWPRIQER